MCGAISGVQPSPSGISSSSGCGMVGMVSSVDLGIGGAGGLSSLSCGVAEYTICVLWSCAVSVGACPGGGAPCGGVMRPVSSGGSAGGIGRVGAASMSIARDGKVGNGGAALARLAESGRGWRCCAGGVAWSVPACVSRVIVTLPLVMSSGWAVCRVVCPGPSAGSQER